MFSVEVEVSELAGMNTVILRILPMDSAEYAILVDFVLTIGEETIEVKRDLWEPGKKVLEKHTASSGSLNLMVCTVQLLSSVNLSRQTAYRNFEVRCGPYNFFVDLRTLAELGGPLFSSWKVEQEAGVDFVEVTEVAPDDMKILLHATARFGSVVIHKQVFDSSSLDNYLVMSILASQYRMLTVLREIESYLIIAKMPLIRKLEFAVELRMARLYDMTMREIGPNAVEEVDLWIFCQSDSALNCVSTAFEISAFRKGLDILEHLTFYPVRPMCFDNDTSIRNLNFVRIPTAIEKHPFSAFRILTRKELGHRSE
ncbi:unnamed protein product [Haemonchus placei]|uniref:FBD domain-containing protein n=1 Tax=Haemonchus placei TaxID=6290 RepID=A0A0N4WAR1_HAEPC|nr:unnamed protein product [Haemonchus placei]